MRIARDLRVNLLRQESNVRTLTVLSAVILGSGLYWSVARSQEPAPVAVDAAQALVTARDLELLQTQVPDRPATPSPVRPTTPAPTNPPQTPVVPPVTTTPPPAVVPEANPALAAETASLFGEGPAPSRGLFDTSRFSGGANPQMLGDQSPFSIRQVIPALPTPFPPGPPPPPPDPRVASALVPSVRGFKIADNQSPQPQDRVFFTFNYFTNLNGTVNKRFESPINNIRVYRYVSGFEKTFDEGRGSLGLRLPLNSITANPAITGNFARPGGTSTALGDLSLFTKYVLKSDPKTGSLISAGLEITLPTGPSQFAGASYLQGQHNTEIQPFIGYVWARDRFYFHGFTSLSTPTSVRDVTMLYNDFGIGYRIYEDDGRDAFLKAIVPTFEVHVNNPLTHRDVFNSRDIAGTADVVDLTLGANMVFGQNSVASFGFVKPVTSPLPFDYEIIFLLNFRFGRTRPTAPLPILGG